MSFHISEILTIHLFTFKVGQRRRAQLRNRGTRWQISKSIFVTRRFYASSRRLRDINVYNCKLQK